MAALPNIGDRTSIRPLNSIEQTNNQELAASDDRNGSAVQTSVVKEPPAAIRETCLDAWKEHHWGSYLLFDIILFKYLFEYSF